MSVSDTHRPQLFSSVQSVSSFFNANWHLLLGSRIERDEKLGKPVLTLTTENKSQFPIPGVTGTLRIGRIDDENNTFIQCFDSTAIMKSSTLITIKK